MLFTIASSFIKAPLHLLNYCALMLIGGIACSATLSISMVIAIGVIVVGVFFLYFKQPLIVILSALFFMSGVYRYQEGLKEHLEFTRFITATPFKIQGTIISIDPQDHPRMKQKLTIQTSTVTPQDKSPLYKEKIIQIYLSKRTNAQIADIIEISDLLIKKNSNLSYEQYLVKEKIAATLFLSALDYKLVNRPERSLSRWLFYFKENLLNRCKKLSRSAFSFFSSVFLGNKMQEKKYMENPKDNCKTWGISHYLARSGLHMVIFICIWHFLLNLLPLSFTLKQIMLILIGLVYHLLSWPSISFIRAFFSFLLFKTCILLQIPSQLLHLLTIVTIAVLLYNPMQLFFLDFQLSFGLTLALAWFNHVAIQQSHLGAKC